MPGLALHHPFGAPPWHGTHAIGRFRRHAALRSRCHHGARQGVFAAALHTGHSCQHSRLISPRSQLQRHQPGLAHGQRARLVKRHGVHPVRHLQRLHVLDQNAVLRRHARARHDGRRCGQPQGTGAGNHQHCHGMNQRGFRARTCPQPAQQRDQCQPQHHGHEHGRNLVHQPLQRRLGGLRVFHQADDLGQHGFRPHRLHLHHDAAIAVDGAARQPAAQLARRRQRLARQHRFIYLRLPLGHHAIGRNALTGAHHQPVAHHHLGHGHVHLAGFRQQVHHIRPQGVQRADGSGGLPLGPRLQPLAQQYQRDHHGRRLKVQVRHVAGVVGRGEPQPHRQAPARAGAHRHQQIHVAAQRLGRRPACFVKPRPQNELHRRGQQKLHPRRQHPVLAKQVAQHGQHQGRRKRQPHRHGQEARPGRGVLRRIGGIGRARLVARIAHRPPHQCLQGSGVGAIGHGVGNARRLGGQVHRGILHAGYLAQRAFHTAHAARAGHAANAQVQRLGPFGGRLGGVHRPDSNP